MNLRRKKRGGFSDSSAASDMAFLLIIYFIVIAGFNINKGFLMNLPARDSSRLIQRDDLLRFELDDAGQITSGGNIISRAEAEGAISAGISANPNLAVMLSVSPEAPWQEVVSFVETAQKLSVEAFSFSMREGAAGEGG
ncbi:MAG: biopolymer transporter ExbD [Spirochaetaceae bacterium]|jgi:biopolymer transport protein ExbD|nr:biopolymer transporter ExbD [Spirochaetaceae bacterium]